MYNYIMAKRKKFKNSYYNTKLVWDKKSKDCFNCPKFNNHMCPHLLKIKDLTTDAEYFEAYHNIKCKGKHGVYKTVHPSDNRLYTESGHVADVTPDDLPDYYHKYWTGIGNRYIKLTNIKEIKYTWVKEDHIFKDSVLYIKYHTGPGMLQSNINMMIDDFITGSSILKALALIEKYSQLDISSAKATMKEQFKYLVTNHDDIIPNKYKNMPIDDIVEDMINNAR